MTSTAPFSAACVSRTGRRPANEDSAVCEVLNGEGIAAFALVCDGMGGHNAGEVASAMATEILAERIRAAAGRPPSDEPEQDLLGWMSEANRTVFARSETQIEMKGMGTTVAAAMVLHDRRLVVANVGDSKVFLVRGPVVTQLSIDHTALAERRRVLGDDEVTPEEEISSPFAHALTRSVGQEPRVLPDSRSDVLLEDGDVVLLTSDGVTDVLESERFLRAIECSPTLDAVAEEIYRLAFEGGSRDNISVALLSAGPPARLGISMTSESRRLPVAAPAPAPRRASQAALGVAGAAALAALGLSMLFAAGRRAPAPPAVPPHRAPAPPTPAPTPAPVRLAARITKGKSAWILALAPAPEGAAALSSGAEARDVRREDGTPLGAKASYPLKCAATPAGLECRLRFADADFTPAKGDVVTLTIAGGGVEVPVSASLTR